MHCVLTKVTARI